MDNESQDGVKVRNTPLTRRQFSRRMAGAVAGTLVGSTVTATAQEEPMKKTPTSVEDPRIALLEKERGVPFTPEQRSGLPAQLKDLDGGNTALRKFALHDGGSEPCLVFQPLSPSRKK